MNPRPTAARPDRRVRRTRDALRAALTALIEEKGYAAISVQDIIDRADVGRSTFYAHFHDKDDLFLGRIGEVGCEGVATPEATGYDRALGFSRGVLAPVREHRRAVRSVIGTPGGDLALARLRQELTARLRLELAALAPEATPSATIEVAARQAVGAFLALLDWWMGNGLQPEVATVDALYRSLTLPGLEAVLGTPRPG
jgi:AcrR family transcriptional regulator